MESFAEILLLNIHRDRKIFNYYMDAENTGSLPHGKHPVFF